MKTFSSRDIIDRLKAALNISADNKLAERLDITKSALSNWQTRNTIDFMKVFSICEQINVDWLVFGRGQMYYVEASEVNSITNSTDHSEIVDKLLNKLDERAQEIGALKERVRQLEDDLNDDTSLNGSDVDDAQTFTANVG
jgi:transcriptional regulator with XRE-family HTH domain